MANTFPTRKNPAVPYLRARAARPTRRLVQHGCTKASQYDWSGSSHKPVPRLAQALNGRKAAVRDFSVRQRYAARSPLVQQSRRRLPKQTKILASSSLDRTRDLEPLRVPAILRPGERRRSLDSWKGSGLRAAPKASLTNPRDHRHNSDLGPLITDKWGIDSVNQRYYLDTSINGSQVTDRVSHLISGNQR